MTVYELLVLNEDVLKMLSDNEVYLSDIAHIEMYKEYCRLEKEGHKKTYIVAYLCEQYGMIERKVYRILKKFEKDIKL